MNPLVIIGIALVAAGVIASATSSKKEGGKEKPKQKPKQKGGRQKPGKKPKQQGDKPSPDGSPLVEDKEMPKKIHGAVQQVTPNFPTTPGKIKIALDDFEEMARERPDFMARCLHVLEGWCKELSEFFQNKGERKKAEQWLKAAEQIRSMAQNQPR